MWTWLFLLLLLEACTGEEGEKMLVLCVGCGHAVAVCGCTCVCVCGGELGYLEHAIAQRGLPWACSAEGGWKHHTQAAGRSMSGYAVNLHEHGKPVGLLAKRCTRVRAHTHTGIWGMWTHVGACKASPV